jgi:hypothetical protein
MFLGLIIPRGQEKFDSKRDGHSYFDSLRPPDGLIFFWGRPPIKGNELTFGPGMKLDEVRSMIGINSGTDIAMDCWFYLVSLVWPVGFS